MLVWVLARVQSGGRAKAGADAEAYEEASYFRTKTRAPWSHAPHLSGGMRMPD